MEVERNGRASYKHWNPNWKRCGVGVIPFERTHYVLFKGEE